jgi:hypothetical protein
VLPERAAVPAVVFRGEVEVEARSQADVERNVLPQIHGLEVPGDVAGDAAAARDLEVEGAGGIQIPRKTHAVSCR